MGNVAYYRVSTKKQGESGLGLEAQEAIVCHFINCDELIAEYTEVASAKNIDGRPLLQEALALCIAEKHTLVVAKIDRLSRKTEDALDIYSRLGRRLISCDIPNLDKMTLTLFMMIADRERELISIRTKAALKAAKKRGVKLGTPENLKPEDGLKGAAATRQAAINGYSQTVGYAQVLREQGSSYQEIAQRLNREGFKTRTGKSFHATTIYRMVQRGK
jgi:DNA invertase Pin-like site-specific DNA recombinase